MKNIPEIWFRLPNGDIYYDPERMRLQDYAAMAAATTRERLKSIAKK